MLPRVCYLCLVARVAPRNRLAHVSAPHPQSQSGQQPAAAGPRLLTHPLLAFPRGRGRGASLRLALRFAQQLLLPPYLRNVPSYVAWNHAMASALVRRWDAPTRPV
jgi:hypothetical protein